MAGEPVVAGEYEYEAGGLAAGSVVVGLDVVQAVVERVEVVAVVVGEVDCEAESQGRHCRPQVLLDAGSTDSHLSALGAPSSPLVGMSKHENPGHLIRGYESALAVQPSVAEAPTHGRADSGSYEADCPPRPLPGHPGRGALIDAVDGSGGTQAQMSMTVQRCGVSERYALTLRNTGCRR